MNITLVPGEVRRQRLEAWIEEYGDAVLRTCYIYLADRVLAEDALQDTFLKVWRSMDRFEGRNGSSVKTWIIRIAINTCKDMRRSAYFRHIDRSISLDQLPEGEIPFTMEDDTITRAVMALKTPWKEAVLLCWYQQLSADEAAQALSVSRSTVYSRLEKARKLLRKELETWEI